MGTAVVGYDSLLLGNGISILLLNRLCASGKLSAIHQKFLWLPDFLRWFIDAPEHSRIFRDFLKLFELGEEKQKVHLDIKDALKEFAEDLAAIGLERWASRHLLRTNNRIPQSQIVYVYLLYNYWAHLVASQILSRNYAKQIAASLANRIRNLSSPTCRVYTTNFDNYLDDWLPMEHLHGRFALPLSRMREVILAQTVTSKSFEYTYLLGGNGAEKLNRLGHLRALNMQHYDFGFFDDTQLSLGNLLIFGLSFSRSEILSDEFLQEYPRHERFYLVRCVDGHILEKLRWRRKKDLLSTITVAYHTDDDYRNISEMFEMADLTPIVSFKHSSEFNI